MNASIGSVARLLAVALVGSCSTTDHDVAGDRSGKTVSPVASSARIYVDGTWDTVFIISGFGPNGLLRQPRLLASRDRLLYAYDYLDAQVKAFDSAGGLRWRTGKLGRGPGDFINALDLEVDANGGVWVLDTGTNRVSVLSHDGSFRKAMDIPDHKIKDIIPLPKALLATVISPHEFLVVFDSAGQATDRVGFPLQSLQSVEPVTRQTFSAIAANGTTWAGFFPFGGLLFVYDNWQPRCTAPLVEPREFLRAGSGPPVTGVAIGMSDSSVYILVKGQTTDAFRVIDQYSAADCRYRRSLRLPRRFLTMTSSDGTFFFAFEDPAPTILALRFTSSDQRN